MAAIMALAPLVAPLIGGVLQTAFGWRSNFVALFCFGAVAAAHGLAAAAGDAAAARAGAGVARSRSCGPIAAFSAIRSFVAHLGIVDLLHVPACSPGFPPRPSCCRTSTGSRPLAFGFTFAVGSCRLSARHHRSRRALSCAGASTARMGIGTRGDGGGRARDGAGCWRSGCTRAGGAGRWRWRSTVRHGHGAAAGAGRRAAAVSGSRRRRVVAGRLHAADARRRWSARSLGHMLGTTAWPLAIAFADRRLAARCCSGR